MRLVNTEILCNTCNEYIESQLYRYHVEHCSSLQINILNIINVLPSYKDNCGQFCSICIDNIQSSYRILRCNHYFCRTCIDKWWLKSSILNCPNCREFIIEDVD